MKLMKKPEVLLLLATLVVPALLSSQEKPAQESAQPSKGSVEFGVRGVFGDVYGRPDLPFTPDVLTSKFNEYGDRRTGFVVPRFRVHLDDILGSRNYVGLQSQSTFYRNQSYLATFGQYGRFKIQFRYDEIPHIYSNTTRSFYVQTGPGIFSILPTTKRDLQDRSSTICAVAQCTATQLSLSLPGFVAGQVSTLPFIVPEIRRKAGSGLASWDIKPSWNVSVFFWRENEVGTRPIGQIFNPSPSASASSLSSGLFNQQSPGTGAEVPEPIDYFNNTVKAATEYAKKNWGVQIGYTGSFFEDNINDLVFDNPFATADVPVLTFAAGDSGCTPTGTATRCAIGAVPSHGQTDLYPSNQAHYLNFAAAFDLGKRVRVMSSINPGWLRQNDAFLPYSANSQIFFPDSTGALTIPATTLSLLPAARLDGQKQTLAMNFTGVYTPLKDFELKVAYRHYDYNNNTAVFDLTPILGDTIGANSTNTGQLVPGTAASGSGAAEDTVGRSNPGFNRKNLEVSGDWSFAKRSSVKVGYEGEWFDRSHRDVAHSMENSVFGAVDYSPWRDLLIRFSGRHQNREPDKYEDEASDGIDCDPAALLAARSAGDFPEVQPCGHRFDESARLLDRTDALVQYSRDKFTVSAGFQTIQQNFNRRGVGSNSPQPLNFLTGTAATTSPYFLYGALKDLSYIYTFDSTYAISPAVSLFAEYAHERYYKRLISRNRSPFNAGPPFFCSTGGCDSANNDWESTYRDIFDTYAAGIDFYFFKKIYMTPYYSLSSGKGNVLSRFLGDPTIQPPPVGSSPACPTAASCPDRFVLINGSAAVPYPETTTRIHELSFIVKFKLTENLQPKFEYRYQQFDNRDYQTTPMTPYMGCVSPATGAAVIGCPNKQLINAVSPTSNPAPTFAPSLFYPGFVVGDTSAARYIFLGADQPSYRVHVFTATLEYRF
jgi:hypothetical protein